MAHYDCKDCGAGPFDPHSSDCPRSNYRVATPAKSCTTCKHQDGHLCSIRKAHMCGSAYSLWEPRTAPPAPPAPPAPLSTTSTPQAPLPAPEPPQAPTATIINPKEIAGAKKPAIWNVVPRWVVLLVGRVMSVGAAKYGRFNYRDSNVSAMTYVDAIERHLQLWQDGEELDDETGVSHLASVMAGCTILLDAQRNGTMGDDRPKTGAVRKTLDDLQRLLVDLPLPAAQY